MPSSEWRSSTSLEPGASALKADGALLLITTVWGVTFVTVKDALAAADPFTFLALRFGLGALAITALTGRRLLEPAVLSRGLWLSIFLFSSYLFQTWGLTHTTPTRSAFITGLAVALVPLVSWSLFGRWPRAGTVAGIGLAIGGLYLLTGGLVGAGETWKGDLLTLACAGTYAVHIALTERFARGLSALPLVGVQLWMTAAFSAACIPFVNAHLAPTPAFVGAVVFCGLFATALALSVQTWGQARTTAVRAALIFALEPVFAAVYSVALGREVLGLRELLGGGLIALGVIAAEVGTRGSPP